MTFRMQSAKSFWTAEFSAQSVPILTQVIVDPYDEAFYTPTKVLGRYMDAEEASAERKKGNYVVEEPGKGFRRIVCCTESGQHRRD